MKLMSKKEFEEYLNERKGYSVAFYEYNPECTNCIELGSLHITQGNPKYPWFGAWLLESPDNPYFEDIESDPIYAKEPDFEMWEPYDWNLHEYSDKDKFFVLENIDVAELIHKLASCIIGSRTSMGAFDQMKKYIVTHYEQKGKHYDN